MRQKLVALVFLVLSIFASVPAFALSALQKQCSMFGASDARINACTKLLNSHDTRELRGMYFLNRGIAWSGRRECDRALTDLDSAVELLTKGTMHYVDALTDRGDVWQHCKGDLEKAQRDYETALVACPEPNGCDSVQAHIAEIFFDRGDIDRSTVEYFKAIEISKRFGKFGDKNRSLFLQDVAFNFREKHEYDRALKYFDDALKVDPSNDTAYTGRGETWRLKGDLRRALHDFDKAIKLDVDSPLKRVYRCRVYRYLGDFEKAIKDCGVAVREVQDFPIGYAELGLVYERKGDLDQAKANFQKALSLGGVGLDTTREAHETAAARLAAIGAGGPLPVIPTVPEKAEAPNALPTPQIVEPATSPEPSEGRRVALVIGNSTYAIGKLRNPLQDAEVIADVLKRVGFTEVTLLKDANREELVKGLRAFADNAEGADWALVYYAGHGIEMSGVNYLLPIDVRLATDRDVQFEAVPLDQVLASIEQAKKLRLVFLDACRDNPFVSGMRRTPAPEAVALSSSGGANTGTRSIGRGLGRINLGSQGGLLVFYAAKDGQTALDGEGADSPFAVAVAQRLATPGVEINKVLRLIRDDVMEATAGRQEPYTYGSLPGSEDFFFVAPH
jgi:tetratricopeptide (TPR) repeat protein